MSNLGRSKRRKEDRWLTKSSDSYVCSECGKASSHIISARHHARRIDFIIANMGEDRVCAKCGMDGFQNVCELADHYFRACLPLLEGETCPKCGVVCKSVGGMKLHFRLRHLEKSEGKNPQDRLGVMMMEGSELEKLENEMIGIMHMLDDEYRRLGPAGIIEQAQKVAEANLIEDMSLIEEAECVSNRVAHSRCLCEDCMDKKREILRLLRAFYMDVRCCSDD